MPTNDIGQADLFGSERGDAVPSAATPSGIELPPPLAIPCGYRNRSNAPCRRLGARPVIIDGEPFHHRGSRVVYCDPACFRDDDLRADHERTIVTLRAEEKAGAIE